MAELLELTPKQIKEEEAKGGMFAWEMRAARGEGSWICSSCCQSFSTGMPDACPNSTTNGCTEIIQRDRHWAQISKEG